MTDDSASDKIVTCIDLDGKEYHVPASKLTWRPSAYAIVIKDGQLLTAKHYGRYNLPGGGIELGETPEEAVVRETKEETGMDVANPRFVTLANNFFVWPSGDRAQYYQTILLYYVCDFVGGNFSMEGFDKYEKEYAEMSEWYTLAKLDELEYTGTHDWRPIVREVYDKR